MSGGPRRLPELLQAMLASEGWQLGASTANGQPAKQDHSQLVFVGNWQDPCPRRLLFDPALEPVDIVTWQVIRVHADASKLVAFPSYATLMQGLGVSRGTLARALAVLRLTRWLPLCAALRDPRGRFAGHVYALNDEPVPLVDMLSIDAGYMEFVESTRSHRSAHVRALARNILDAIQAAAAPSNPGLESPGAGDHIVHRVDRMARLVGRHVQNLNPVYRVQNLNANRSSSSTSKETTTTPVVPVENEGPSPDRPSTPGALVFPEALSLTESQRRVLLLRLESVPTEHRQAILDEAAGRVLAKRKTADPVRCEFDYIARLCAKALTGQFVPTDAGERIRRHRQESAGVTERLRRAREYSETQRLREIERHRAQSQGVPDSRVRSANKTDSEH